MNHWIAVARCLRRGEKFFFLMNTIKIKNEVVHLVYLS